MVLATYSRCQEFGGSYRSYGKSRKHLQKLAKNIYGRKQPLIYFTQNIITSAGTQSFGNFR
jgi:hypothetical protein